MCDRRKSRCCAPARFLCTRGLDYQYRASACVRAYSLAAAPALRSRPTPLVRGPPAETPPAVGFLALLTSSLLHEQGWRTSGVRASSASGSSPFAMRTAVDTQHATTAARSNLPGVAGDPFAHDVALDRGRGGSAPRLAVPHMYLERMEGSPAPAMSDLEWLQSTHPCNLLCTLRDRCTASGHATLAADGRCPFQQLPPAGSRQLCLARSDRSPRRREAGSSGRILCRSTWQSAIDQ